MAEYASLLRPTLAVGFGNIVADARRTESFLLLFFKKEALSLLTWQKAAEDGGMRFAFPPMLANISVHYKIEPD